MIEDRLGHIYSMTQVETSLLFPLKSIVDQFLRKEIPTQVPQFYSFVI